MTEGYIKNECEQKLQSVGLLKKLSEIQKSIISAQKDGLNKYHKFKYVSINSILDQIKPLMDSKGVLLNMRTVSSIISDREVETEGKIKRRFVHENEYECIFIDTETGEAYVAEKCFKSIGIDSAELGLGKSISYAKKYFLLNFFNIPSFDESEEPDNKDDSSPVVSKPNGFSALTPKNPPPVKQEVKSTKEQSPAFKDNHDKPLTVNQMKFWFSAAARNNIMVGNKTIRQYVYAIHGIDLKKEDDISELTNSMMQIDLSIFAKGEQFTKSLVKLISDISLAGFDRDAILDFLGVDFIDRLTKEGLIEAEKRFKAALPEPDESEVPF